MKFIALEVSLDVIRSLRVAIAPLRKSDPKLYDQIRRAASSVALNLAEGRRRRGADRRHFWRIAAGSADEVQTALRVSVAWGDLSVDAVEDTLAILDRLLGLLWGLTR